MCGICGFYIDRPDSDGCGESDLVNMTDSLAHRGPDSKGFYFKESEICKIGLGHRRLSIIDLSDSANQPIENEDGSVVVILNGEIYNYRELTDDLKAKGHIFKSKSDTEVIVHLYEEYKEKFLEKLEGMFAVALYDSKRNQLLLARDRLGIKPLFYTHREGQIYFASEIKSLLQLSNITRKLDYISLDSYFTYGYVPGDRSIFKDIKKLPPSAVGKFSGDEFTISSYWRLQYQPKLQLTECEIQKELYRLLIQSVRSHLVSDVPIGAYLSGGIDSSIIVALMKEAVGNDIKTFSIGYATGGKDELDYANEVARLYRTDHHEFRIDPDMTGILPNLLWYLDEPFFDNSIIPSFYISQLARENVVVALSGDGGDEMFGGYEWARRYQYNLAYNMLPKFVRKAAGGMLAEAIEPDSEYGTDLNSKFKRLFFDLNHDLESGFHRRTTVSHQFRQSMYSDELKDKLGLYDAGSHQLDLFQMADVDDEREKMTYVDTMAFLPDDCLFKVDRMSMANGLEVRVPFLDRKVVEFSARIPFHYKIRGLSSKYILKNTFRRSLPPNILKQRKQGFTIPISSWLKGKLGNLVENLLLNGSLEKRRLIKTEQIKFMIDSHRSGKQELGHRIWSLAVFEIWARLYLDTKISSRPDLSLEQMVN